MEKGELDEYMSQFQQLAELTGYHEQTSMICYRYFQGLPQGLQESMIAFEPTRHYQRLDDWIKWAIRQHSKYLTYQSYFGGRKNFNPRNPNVTIGLHHLHRRIGLHRFLAFSLPYTEAHVRYDLAALTCTIRSC